MSQSISRALACAAAALLALPALAQQGYQLPPPDVLAIAEAEPTPRISLSPDGSQMLLLERAAMPSIAEVARRMLRLAGMRIDPAANARFSTSSYKGLLLRAVAGEESLRVPLPDGARLMGVEWSHNSRWFQFTLTTGRGSELWIGDARDAAHPHRISGRLNSIMGGAVWMPDGEHLLVRQVPLDRGEEPAPAAAPSGPVIRESLGRSSPLRTYQDLLRSEEDALLFEYYATTRLMLISADGKTKNWLEQSKGIFASIKPSPDGKLILIERVTRPFSQLMPYSRFPREVDVIDLAGKRVQHVASVSMGEGIPIGGVRTGPRSFSWKASADATLVWCEALDGGDPKQKVAQRDRWLVQDLNGTSGATEVLRTEHRASGLTWLPNGAGVLAAEYDRDLRWTRTFFHGLQGSSPQLLEDRSVRDRYGNPGSVLTERNARGQRVATLDGGWLYRAGSGSSPAGDLPFLDRQNIASGKSERLWRCAKGSYESVTRLIAGQAGKALFVTQHETPTSPPNYRLHDLGGAETQSITDFPDPTPQIRGIKKQLVTYARPDGVPLSATLYLPADYVAGTRLPLFVWAYPREFNDARTAGQVSGSPSRFVRISGSSHLYLVTQGYAIMDGATIPIIGDAETMNDTFITQLVAGAQAAIAKAVEMGVADGDRVGVGGHSYGAFMTANLLAHCDLFDAGIARSGAYNRTLTPFGFQSERRTLWEAPETYFAVSPFMHAHKINEPMLMIHGVADNNSGTFPMQSERLYQAIKGNGGTTRLVMLPAESHGYRARESVLHVLHEMIRWMDIHVKSGSSASAAEASAGEGK